MGSFLGLRSLRWKWGSAGCNDARRQQSRGAGASRQRGLEISSRLLSLFIIGSYSLVRYLYYLASDLPGLRPPWLQTWKML